MLDNSVDEPWLATMTMSASRFTLMALLVYLTVAGIPVDIHPEENRSAAEVIMTSCTLGVSLMMMLTSIWRSYSVGVSVVNALSESGLTIERMAHAAFKASNSASR